MKRHIIDVIQNNEHGLNFLTVPTGFGKSYTVKEVIKELLEDISDTRKIIFITPNKKNLLNEFENSEYANDVLILRSNMDQVIDVLPDLDVPEQFQTSEYHKVLTLVKKLKNLKDRKNADADYIKTVEEKLMEAECLFRREIRQHLKNTFKKKNISLNAVRTQRNYRWIGELYPAVFTDDYRVLIMTVEKFLSKNSVIVDRSYDILTSEIVDNAIIFIDESDASKAVMTNHIIKQTISILNEYPTLFMQIKNRLVIENMSRRMRVSLESIQRLKSNFDEIIALGNTLSEQYMLYLSYKTLDGAIDNRQNFLFNDGNFHTILRDMRNYIRTAYNKRNNCVDIAFESKEEYIRNRKDSDLVIYSMLRSIRTYLSMFRILVYNWAESYKNLINSERGAYDDEMSTDNAVSSILNRIGLTCEQQTLLMNECCHIRTAATSLLPENDHYTRGFEVFEFKDSDEHNESTDISYIRVYDTPEKIMRYLSERAVVFAVSATADFPSVLGNFDLNYLEETLGDRFHKPDGELNRKMEEQMKEISKPYKEGRVKIHTEALDSEYKGDIEKLCLEFLSPEYARLASAMINNTTADKYFSVRYCNILRVMRRFFEHSDIRSLLCLQNALPGEDMNMNEGLLKSLFKLAAHDADADYSENEFKVLRTDNFDNDKEALLKELGNGSRRFVMSSYSTIGAGQNLQYEIKDKSGFVELCPSDDPNDKRHFTKDFDALYLGNITNLTVNTYSGKPIPKEDLFHILFQAESLYYNGELNYKDTDDMIKLAFNRFSGASDRNINKIYNTKSMRTYVSQLTIQAVGRMCRTYIKNPDIYLFADKKLLDMLDTAEMKKRILSPEVKALINESRNLGAQYTDEENKLLNLAERTSTNGMWMIRSLLSHNWTEKSIRLWNEMRECVLCYPTASDKLKAENEIINKLYITSGNDTDSYIYSQYSDFGNVTIDFSNDAVSFANSGRAKIKGASKDTIVLKMSEEDSGLSTMMKYKPLKSYFEENGYASAFDKQRWVMSPVLYHNIYKGALGEAAGSFILKNERGIELKPITDPDKFEFFDYILSDDVYVDFKNWKYTYIQDKETTRKEILAKLDAIGGKRVYVINMINSENSKPSVLHDGRIIEIPGLMDKDGRIISKMLDMIEEDK